MGQASRDFGAELEKPVKKKLEQLQVLGVVAHFHKNQPAFALAGKGPPPDFEPRYIRVAASGADFEGTLGLRSGRPGLSFALEVKSVGPKPPKQGRGMQTFIREARMPDDQISHLDAVARSGAVSLLLLQWRPEDEPWFVTLIPWAEVPWRTAKVRSHIDMEAARPWRTGGDRDGLAASFFADGARMLASKST